MPNVGIRWTTYFLNILAIKMIQEWLQIKVLILVVLSLEDNKMHKKIVQFAGKFVEISDIT